ncbi:hypothetical protein [Pseudophaeobacter sp.]|uniref:hypothetical protein n=1 Tax=Pseudophaeobacter sp. TaxID=1971739 RepID=UPI00329883DD
MTELVSRRTSFAPFAEELQSAAANTAQLKERMSAALDRLEGAKTAGRPEQEIADLWDDHHSAILAFVDAQGQLCEIVLKAKNRGLLDDFYTFAADLKQDAT